MPHHILIVDDAQELAQLFAQLLGDAGYSTAIATTGPDALAQLQARRPDLLLLDVNLPELDGYALASMLKSDPATATIPIVMVSAQEGRGARVIGLESGAEDYLAKPVDPAELLAKVRNLLALRDRSAHAART